jgi:hypothetical protein
VSGPGWLTRDLDDVPLDDSWLGDRERLVLAGLRLAKRRRDWRLGRWRAKTAVAALLDVPLVEIEVFAAFDGAPEVRIDGAPAPVSLSISHRAGRALAAVWSRGAIGCDLELIEPRSDAFVSEWLAPPEQALVAAAAADDRARLVNLLWTAKEGIARRTRTEGSTGSDVHWGDVSGAMMRIRATRTAVVPLGPGRQIVDDVPTQRYRVSVDLTRALSGASGPAAAALSLAIQEQLTTLGAARSSAATPSVSILTWVDRSGRVVEMRRACPALARGPSWWLGRGSEPRSGSARHRRHRSWASRLCAVRRAGEQRWRRHRWRVALHRS